MKTKRFFLAAISMAFIFTFYCKHYSDDDSSLISSSSDIDIVDESSSDRVDESSSSMQEEQPSSSSGVTFYSPVRAVPVSASNSGEPEIFYSWTDGSKNHYVIYAGHIDKVFVSEIGIVHYNGIPMKFRKTTTTSNTLTTSMTETVSNSIIISNSSELKTTLDAAVKARVKLIYTFSVGLKLEETISKSVTTANSTKTELTTIDSKTESESTKLSFEIGKNGEPSGHYRYALFATTDVYFVISTDLNNEELLSWDVVSCVREGTYVPWWEYSPDGKFDNSPIGNQIEFADDFYRNLPKPTIVYYPKVERIKDTLFTVGHHVYNFDKGDSATIEVYALGAGGGGQGGHWWTSRNTIFTGDANGTGGSGGGGAAAYMKLVVKEPVSFDIIVGKGGEGGTGERNGNAVGWNPGISGESGDSTSVTWASKGIALIAGGGSGGYKSGGCSTSWCGSGHAKAGSGGRVGVKPTSLLIKDWLPKNGSDGANGVDWGCVESKGGKAASIIGKGSYSSFEGGSGGWINCGSTSRASFSGTLGGGGSGGYGDYNSSRGKGGNGGDGQVRIVVKYLEELRN
jgi:hypothetical protein